MNKKPFLKTFSVLALSSLILVPILSARPNTSVKTTLSRAENINIGTKNKLIMPYAFSTESMGFTAGAGAGTKGYGQEQLLLGATAFYSAEKAVGLFLGMWDYQPPFARRFFLSAQGMISHFPTQRAYTKLAFDPNAIRPGSNDSDMNAYGEDSGYSNWTDFKLEYVLPIGSARTNPMQHNIIKGGLLQSATMGGESWNPLKSGVSILFIKQYNRYQSFELDQGDIDATAHPVQAGFGYYNTDFYGNPSTGSSQYFAITHDFGWLDSPDDWTFIEFEASKYFSLGDSDWAKQRIIALNMWTADNSSWTETTNADGTISISHRAPFYEGSNLGGFYRMRAYPTDRFNDKSVLYATAEYRYTLNWNPIGNISWLKFLKSDWLQLVPFVEGGRVANDYNEDLLKDWQFDAGVSLRSMFSGAVVRFDIATSDETTSAWVMFGHPF